MGQLSKHQKRMKEHAERSQQNLVTDPNGMVWTNNGPGTDDHLGFAGHEIHIVEIAKGLMTEGGTFLDIGAHVGLYTLNLANKAGRVLALEANRKTFDTLKQNVTRNAKRYTATVSCANVAAWDSSARLSLTDENGRESGGSTWCAEDDDGLVAGHPVDLLVPEWQDIALVKMDVEGAEGRVLRGMEATLRREKPILLIEMHDGEYDNPEIRVDVLETLANHEYTFDDSVINGGQYYIIAKHKDHDDGIPEIEVVKAGQ